LWLPVVHSAALILSTGSEWSAYLFHSQFHQRQYSKLYLTYGRMMARSHSNNRGQDFNLYSSYYKPSALTNRPLRGTLQKNNSEHLSTPTGILKQSLVDSPASDHPFITRKSGFLPPPPVHKHQHQAGPLPPCEHPHAIDLKYTSLS